MNWTKTLAIVGALAGLAHGLYALISAYTAVPSAPSVLEGLLQVAIVAVLVLAYTAIGFVLGFVVSKLARNRRD